VSAWETPWTTIALAAGIALVALIRGKFSETLWIALLGLLLLGAALPPAGALTGALVLFYLVLVHGREVFATITTTLGGKPT